MQKHNGQIEKRNRKFVSKLQQMPIWLDTKMLVLKLGVLNLTITMQKQNWQIVIRSQVFVRAPVDIALDVKTPEDMLLTRRCLF